MLSITDDKRREPILVYREHHTCFAIDITHGDSGLGGDPDPHPIDIRVIGHMEERLPFGVKGEQGARVPLSINEAELLGADDCGHLHCRLLRDDRGSANETGGNNSTK
jgi:hypothetical protein